MTGGRGGLWRNGDWRGKYPEVRGVGRAVCGECILEKNINKEDPPQVLSTAHTSFHRGKCSRAVRTQTAGRYSGARVHTAPSFTPPTGYAFAKCLKAVARPSWLNAVSYTHLTLPTILLV